MSTFTPAETEPVVYANQTEHGSWRVAGTRILLDSIIYAYREGATPEKIVSEYYPSLTLEQVHGATAFYLRHREQLDRYLAESEEKFERLRDESRKKDPQFRERILSRWQKLQAEKET